MEDSDFQALGFSLAQPQLVWVFKDWTNRWKLADICFLYCVSIQVVSNMCMPLCKWVMLTFGVWHRPVCHTFLKTLLKFSFWFIFEQRKREREIFHILVHSSKHPHQPGMERTKARSPDLSPGVWPRLMGLMYLSHHVSQMLINKELDQKWRSQCSTRTLGWQRWLSQAAP